MKLEVKMEDGRPIIFLLSDIEDNKIICWTDKEEHASATRSYMRSLPKPVTRTDILASWETLQRYSVQVAYTMRL